MKLEVRICFLPCVKTFSEDKITSQSSDGPRARWRLVQRGCQAGGVEAGGSQELRLCAGGRAAGAAAPSPTCQD